MPRNARKAGEFLAAWGGIAGVQSTLPVLIDGGYHMIYKQMELLASCGKPQWVSGDAAQLNVGPDGGRVVFARGAYSYLAVGAGKAVEQLAKPIQNTLYFAGEAVSLHSFQSVRGAYETGLAAVGQIIAELGISAAGTSR